MTTGIREFVTIWQKAEFLDDVAMATGKNRNVVRMRAFNLRKKGIPLKELKSRSGTSRGVDYEAIAEYAKSLVKP